MYGFLLAVLVLDGIFLSVVILLQAGKGGGLAAVGGGGGTMASISEGHVTGSAAIPGPDIVPAARGPGEHIGELAMLRHQPRSLTAIAGPDGMHGLVMDCRLLESLVEQRPQIATAMLTTLADILAETE